MEYREDREFRFHPKFKELSDAYKEFIAWVWNYEVELGGFCYPYARPDDIGKMNIDWFHLLADRWGYRWNQVAFDNYFTVCDFLGE
jgi:hypothetical protein